MGIDIVIPLFVLFRALGSVSDKQILSQIIYENDPPKLKSRLLDELRASISDTQPIYDQKSAMKLLAMNTKGKEIINVIDILANNFLPNYKSNSDKCSYLGYSVRKLILTKLGIIKENCFLDGIYWYIANVFCLARTYCNEPPYKQYPDMTIFRPLVILLSASYFQYIINIFYFEPIKNIKTKIDNVMSINK